jgi:hypothetical protein
MSKIGRQSETNGMKDYKVANLFRNIMDMVDGRLTIDDNIQGKIIRNVLFTDADFDYPIVHNLGRVINDYVILNQNNYAMFRQGDQTNTAQRLYLRCDTAGVTATILIWG